MKIFDLHNDFLTEIKSNKNKERYINNKKNNDVFHMVSAVWTSEMSQEKAIKEIRNANNLIYKNKPLNKYSLAIEDLHFISKNYLYEIINYKPLYCGLTWNNDNILAGGALDGGDLTYFGLTVVKELENNNIVVDTAHLSEKSFMSFSKITENPILCSHTAVNTLVNNNRNLKDYQIKMIVESNGLIGLALVGSFLTNDKKATISDVARHIDYIVSRFGDKNIALGTDFYGTKNLPKGIKNYSNLKLLEERLKIIGYPQETIDNIFYKNAERFFNVP